MSDFIALLFNSPSANPSAGVVALRRSEGFASAASGGTSLNQALIRKKETASRAAKPAYHPDWKLMRVISGHLGWVRSVAVEPGNKWFATGAGDRVIKVRERTALSQENSREAGAHPFQTEIMTLSFSSMRAFYSTVNSTVDLGPGFRRA